MSRFLNYASDLHRDTVGQMVGPDTKGRLWRICELMPREDGQPGTRVRLALVKP